ncbi:palmitoyltransferase ZDHHC14-like [Ruditapes philippinarum]|uniref:palmitoyltransferase ZDHHC14-like n=1 Tax=Ruditapes philippinarum TaxID=129788 RepID=UPI00295B6504|nr:palmitoyltransferase ZDHHC14-like [Ruditapes philippinarum]
MEDFKEPKSPKTQGETGQSVHGQGEIKSSHSQDKLKSSLCQCKPSNNQVGPGIVTSKDDQPVTVQILDETKTSSNFQRKANSKGKTKRRRKWEVFPGGNKFCCKGRYIRGPDSTGYLITLALILIIGGLFFSFDSVYLSKRVSPVVPALGVPIFLLMLVLFNVTAFTDPGILPRATAYDIEKQEEINYKTDDNGSRYTETDIKGRVFQQQYCRTCKIYRPPRSSHCSVCDNCVERFDHHCPFLSNCIGKRNYKHYFILLIIANVLSCYVIGCNVAVISFRAQEYPINEAFMKSIPSVIEGILCLLILLTGLLCLVVYHTRLVCREETTNESLKDTFANNINPFSQGRWYSNCFYILCTPKAPKLLDRRGFEDDADVSQESSRNPPTPPI